MTTIPKALISSNSSEWFTPPEIIERVRATFGVIDLDPASCAEANKTVNALRYYSLEVGIDGLSSPWGAETVFCNPPYGFLPNLKQPEKRGAPQTQAWVQKALAESRKNFEHGILLVNARTSERWFHDLAPYPICFTRRLHFLSADGLKHNQPSQGSAIILLSDSKRMARNFEMNFHSVANLFYIP